MTDKTIVAPLAALLLVGVLGGCAAGQPAASQSTSHLSASSAVSEEAQGAEVAPSGVDAMPPLECRDPDNPFYGEPLEIETAERDLVAIGLAAGEAAFARYCDPDLPPRWQILHISLSNGRLIAGDAAEFCIAFHYDITLAVSDSFHNPANGEFLGENRYTDCYKEIRLLRLEEGRYRVVEAGTGMVGMGLDPVKEGA